jgi:alkylhydroperoxidase/carboxymuconolactone decarboxylase family protein YurZ
MDPRVRELVMLSALAALGCGGAGRPVVRRYLWRGLRSDIIEAIRRLQ